MSNNSSPDEKQSGTSRRKFLSALGTGAALTSIPAVSARSGNSTTNTFQNTIEQANRLRARLDKAKAHTSSTGRHQGNENAEIPQDYSGLSPREGWKKFLQERGHAVGTVQYTTTIDTSTSDGISTNQVGDVDSVGVDAEMALSTGAYTTSYYAELNFRLRFGAEGLSCVPSGDNGLVSCSSWGEAPLDTLALGWNENCWSYVDPDSISDSTSTSANVAYEDDYYSLSSMGFEADDVQMWQDWKVPNEVGNYSYSDLEFGGVTLESRECCDADCQNNKDTTILGAYNHTWNGSYESFDISVGLPLSIGISYSQTNNLQEETTKTEKDNDTPLRISKDDAEYVS